MINSTGINSTGRRVWRRLCNTTARAYLAGLSVAFWLMSSEVVLAAKKKAQEAAPPTKSYVGAYFIVMMLVGVGLMTVCRPGKRKERPDEKKPDEE